MAAKPVYPPFTLDEYIKTYTTFITTCDEYDVMIRQIKPVVKGFGGKPVKMLNIGAGTARIEKDMMDLYGRFNFHFQYPYLYFLAST